LVPGQPFTMRPEVNASLSNVAAQAFPKNAALEKTADKVVKGWLIPRGGGSYGSNYFLRAYIAACAWRQSERSWTAPSYRRLTSIDADASLKSQAWDQAPRARLRDPKRSLVGAWRREEMHHNPTWTAERYSGFAGSSATSPRMGICRN
jgi:hypothetical protein